MKNAEMIQLYVDVSCDEARIAAARGNFYKASEALKSATTKLEEFNSQRSSSFKDLETYCSCSSRLKIAQELLDQTLEAKTQKETL